MARLARQEVRRWLGLKAPWGRHAKIRIATSAKERLLSEAEKTIATVLETLPAVREDKPVAEMDHSELLFDVSRRGLLRLRETLMREREPDDLKGERLVCEMALGVNKLLANVQEAALRGRRTDQLSRILAAIAKASTEDLTEP